ncbi:MAG TPA: hypothetical protein VFY87_29845 [Geminicoccaceae bacterium]|nr:hypothetical protein [Geminicoccaceae bacterium]
MAAETKDQGSKDKVAKGMDEAGKDQIGKAGQMPKTGAGGSKDLAEGMSKSGSGKPTGSGEAASKRR